MSNNITNVTIPSSVVNIGEGAFWSCESLKSIILPDGLASIEYVAFGSCTNLTNVTIPSSLVNIGDSAFDNCKSLKSIILPDGLAGIGNRMFCYCTNLENVTIPSSVTNIGSGAFSNCTNLENVTIPSSVTNIGDGAFGDCKSLGNITIPGSVQFIGSGAFKGCESLKTIGIPSSVKVIDDRTFAGCINLTTITLPNGLTTIKGAAFTGCANLTHIEIPESVTVIEGYAFSCCFALENMTLPSGLLSIGDGVFKNCEALKDINIPDNVTKIGDYAFYECYSLDSITIPSSVTEIGKYAFEWCTHLESVIIPDGVKSIGLCAFQRCENLKTVIIPNSVTYIGISAFSNCGLTNVIIPDSVTKLERETFFYCEKLKSVIIPLSVKSIGFQTFGACDNLQEASYLGTEENWASVDVDSGNTPLLNAIHFTNFPTQESFIVSFDANGGTGTPSSQIKQENVSLTLSSIKPSKRYTISYNSCGGSVSPASKSVNCTFKNWNTAKNGSGTSYASGGNYSSNADATLYAQWTNPKAGELATPTRSGYAFVGWYTASSGGNQVTDSSAITGNVTLYAHWKDPYNLGDETYSFENYGDYHRDGHCFGMSITSAGYYNNLLDIRRIGGNTNTPLFSFGDTQTVREPICYYSDIQGTYSNRAIVAGGSHYKYGFFNLSSDWQSVVDYVKNHRYDNTGLLQIGLRKKKPNKISGHAVNFLRYEKVNGQDRIYAYDNNFPNVETYFYQDSSGKVLQYPVATYRDGIDCICLRDASIYFSNVGDFDFTHVLHMDNNTTLVEGYTFSYMDGDSDDSEYVMYEIPANQDRVTIIPKKNDANFIYMDTEFSFGEITDNTRGILKLSSMDQDSGGLDASFIIYEESESAIIPTVTLSKNTFTYNGKVQKPAVTVKAGSKVLTESQDYIVEYPSGMVDVGSYKVKITLIGNYSGVLYDTYEIVKATQPLAASNLSLTYQKNGTIKVSGNKGKLTYKSSNTSVATVDSTGKVTAKGAGKATITITAAATSNYNAATKTITVNVAKAAQSITAKAGASTIAVGKTTTVSINGNKGTKSYKSSNTTIATVTSAGKVTAKKVGTVKITATSAATAQYNAASKTVTIKVVPAATTSLTAANQATGIKLTWKKVTGANGYKVFTVDRL